MSGNADERAAAGKAPGPIRAIQDAAGGAMEFVSDRASDIAGFAQGVAASLIPEPEASSAAAVRDAAGKPVIPTPLLDDREKRELSELAKRYEELTEPGLLERAGQAAFGLLPPQVKDAAQQAAETLTQQQLYAQMMKIVAEGFGTLERMASVATVSENQVLAAFGGAAGNGPTRLGDICLMRAYDVARVANSQNYQHILAAFAEGGATGAVGFAGIPFNIVLGTFLYYRAVQSAAMFYGYDVKNDPAELVIASEVLSVAFAPKGADLGGAVGMVGKVMALAETATVGQVVKKGWTAMAQRGGACLLITQMRALAHASARKALERAGKEGIERSVFRNVFEQIGKRLPQKAVQRGVPVVGGIIGALFDTGQMQRTLAIADAFYHKRFLVEKELRVMSLAAGVDLESSIDEVTFDSAPDLIVQG